MDVKQEVANEINTIRRLNLKLFDEIGDLTVCLRSHVNQCMTCYATTHREHTSKLILRAAAHVEIYFWRNEQEIQVQPVEYNTYAKGLLSLDYHVRQMEQAIVRGSKGDAVSGAMDVLACLVGILAKFGL